VCPPYRSFDEPMTWIHLDSVELSAMSLGRRCSFFPISYGFLQATYPEVDSNLGLYAGTCGR